MTRFSPLRRRVGLLLLGTTVLARAPLAAAQSSPDAEAKARALFEEARTKACPEAIPLFKRSLALFEGRGALLNLASCQEKVGRLLDAESTYQRLLPKLEPGDDRRPIVEGALEALRKRIPTLRLEPPRGVPGVTARLEGDGPDAQRLPFERRVDPGRELVVYVDFGDGTVRTHRLTLREGEMRTFTVPGAEAPAAADTSAGSGADQRASDSTGDSSLLSARTGWIGVGIGSAAMIGALVAGGMALGKKSALEEECPVAAQCSAEGKDIARSGQTLTDVGTGLAIGGAVLAGAGVVVVVLSGPGRAGVSLGPRGAHLEGSF